MIVIKEDFVVSCEMCENIKSATYEITYMDADGNEITMVDLCFHHLQELYTKIGKALKRAKRNR